jgi:hypothetical protein
LLGLDSPRQALPAQHRQLAFGHVQPTGMFGRVMNLKPLV